MKKIKKPLLLHVCCGPCASGCLPYLQSEEYAPTLFFSNSNLDTAEEFEKRYAEAVKLAERYRLPLIRDEYRHDLWLEAVRGYEGEPERGRRCCRCFGFSFARASAKAAELEMPFTTSLTVSPYKNSDVILVEGSVYDNFEFFNFKKRSGYATSQQESKKLGMYRQNYCGCEFSKRK